MIKSLMRVSLQGGEPGFQPDAKAWRVRFSLPAPIYGCVSRILSKCRFNSYRNHQFMISSSVLERQNDLLKL